MWLLFIELDFMLFELFIEEELDFMCSFFIDELFVECIAPVGFGDAPLIWSAIAAPEAAKNAAAMMRDVKRIRENPPLRWDAMSFVRRNAVPG